MLGWVVKEPSKNLLPPPVAEVNSGRSIFLDSTSFPMAQYCHTRLHHDICKQKCPRLERVLLGHDGANVCHGSNKPIGNEEDTGISERCQEALRKRPRSLLRTTGSMYSFTPFLMCSLHPPPYGMWKRGVSHLVYLEIRTAGMYLSRGETALSSKVQDLGLL